MSTSDSFNEPEAFAELRSEFRKCGKLFQDVGQVPMGKPDSLDQYEKALGRLPEAGAFQEKLEELKSKSREKIREATRHRHQRFKSLVTEFVFKRSDSEKYRETSTGYRIGPLELVLLKERSAAELHYNRERVVPRFPIVSVDGLSNAYSKALHALESSEIESKLRSTILVQAFKSVAGSGKAGKTDRVGIKELYKEFRVALCRHEIQTGKPDKRLKFAEFPIWRFLYNLDRYWQETPEGDRSSRLIHETGSQREATSGLGMTINGLAPGTEYKTICYVRMAR